MADDDNTGFIPLEDPTADPAPDPEPAPAPAPAPEPPPIAAQVETSPETLEDEDDLESQVVPDRLTGERMVPLHEVSKLREKARTRREEAETLSAKVKVLEGEAARVKELEDLNKQWQAYYASTLQQTPGPRTAGPDPAVQQQREQHEQARRQRAEKIAKRFDLFKPDGTLDVDRGLEHLGEQEELAREQAAQMVAPLRIETAKSKSHANRAALTAHLQKRGTPVDTALFNQLWTHLTPELTSQQEVAAVAAAAALGWPLLFGTQAPAQVQQAVAAAAPAPVERSPVVVTEPVSQRNPGPPRLQGIAARTARSLGLTDKQVEERYGNTAGMFVLADDTEG